MVRQGKGRWLGEVLVKGRNMEGGGRKGHLETMANQTEIRRGWTVKTYGGKNGGKHNRGTRIGLQRKQRV